MMMMKLMRCNASLRQRATTTINRQTSQLRFMSTESDKQQPTEPKKVEPSASRGDLQLMSARMCLSHYKRLSPAKDSEVAAWIHRTTCELSAGMHYFDGDSLTAKREETINDITKEIELMTNKLEATMQEEEQEEEGDDEPQENERRRQIMPNWGMELGCQLFTTLVGRDGRKDVEYFAFVGDDTMFTKNDRLLARSGHENQFHRVKMAAGWVAMLHGMAAEYQMSEFMEGAELGFCAFNKALHDRDREFIKTMTSEELYCTIVEKLISDDGDSKMTWDVMDFHECGGYKIQKQVLQQISVVEVEGELCLGITVRFECLSRLKMVTDGKVITSGEENADHTVTMEFTSPQPVDGTELEWRINRIVESES